MMRGVFVVQAMKVENTPLEERLHWRRDDLDRSLLLLLRGRWSPLVLEEELRGLQKADLVL